MTKYALIKNNIVEDIVEISEDFASSIANQWDYVLDISSETDVKRGYIYDGSDFSKITKDPISSDEAWDIIRNERDKKLKDTDFTQLADAPYTSEELTEYQNYRQELRDLPSTIIDPVDWLGSGTWPTEPGA